MDTSLPEGSVFLRFVLDAHTHSLSCGHAYSTVTENARQAAQIGLSCIAFTDHGPAMPHTASDWFFGNLRMIPRQVEGVEILTGVELNILDTDGKIDLPQSMIERLAVVIASLHGPCIRPGSARENTQALIRAMENPAIKIIGHPCDPHYPLELEALVDAAARTGTFLEVNNHSLEPGSGRDGGDRDVLRMLELCKAARHPVVLGSDAHFHTAVGDFALAEGLLAQAGLPDELVLNIDIKRFKNALRIA